MPPPNTRGKYLLAHGLISKTTLGYLEAVSEALSRPRGSQTVWCGLTALCGSGLRKTKNEGAQQQGESQMWQDLARISKWWNRYIPFSPACQRRPRRNWMSRMHLKFPPDTNEEDDFKDMLPNLKCTSATGMTWKACLMPSTFWWQLSLHLSKVMNPVSWRVFSCYICK